MFDSRQRFLTDVTAISAASSSLSFVAAGSKIRPKSAKRSTHESLLNSNATGNNIALENPCGTLNRAPIGRDIPCTKQTEAFENAIPACNEPKDIACRD